MKKVFAVAALFFGLVSANETLSLSIDRVIVESSAGGNNYYFTTAENGGGNGEVVRILIFSGSNLQIQVQKNFTQLF